MNARGRRIDSPSDNRVALYDFVVMQSGRVTHDNLPADIFGRRAYGALQPRGPQTMKEGMAAIALHQTHGPSIRTRYDRFCAVPRNYIPPAADDVFDSIIPRNRTELTFSLGTDPDQWPGQPPG